MRPCVSSIVLPLAALSLLSSAWAQDRPATSPGPRFVTQRPPAESPVDWIFLIDTSKTMTERIEGMTILDRVKSTLREFTGLLRPNDTLSAWVFDAASRRLSPRIAATGSDLEQFVRQIGDLQALGEWTHTGAALADGLREVYERPVLPGQAERPVAVVLLTDGREDLRGIPPEKRIPVSSAIDLIRDERTPYVFYVSLGTKPDPALMAFLDRINRAAPGRGGLFADHGGRRLSESVNEMRKRAQPPEPLQIRPAALDVGKVYAGGSSDSAFIEIFSHVDAGVTLRTNAAPYGHTIAFDPPGPVMVGPHQWTRVRVRLDVAADASVETAAYSLAVTPVNPPGELRSDEREIPLQVKVTRSPWMMVLSGSMLLLVLLLLAYVLCYWSVLGVRPGETPLVGFVVRLFQPAATSPLPAVLEARDGRWTIPLAAADVVVDAASSSGLAGVVASVRLRSMGVAAHEMSAIEGPVRWRRPGEPFAALAPGSSAMLSHRSEIELGGADGTVRILRYVGRRSEATASRRAAASRSKR